MCIKKDDYMGLATIIASGSLIISAISLIFTLKGKIVFTGTPAGNNIESTADKKFRFFIILITNTFLKTISLTCFTIEDNNKNKLNSETMLYLSPSENPPIIFLNIPPGETRRIMVKVSWQGQ